MADLAVIGIEARSDSLVTASKNLDNLSNAAHRADAAVDSFNASAAATPPVATGMTRATNATIMAMNAQASAAQAVARSNKLAGHQMTNLASQVTDVGVSLASGMNPFLVMLQQGTQIAQVFGPGTGVVGILKGLVQTIGTMVRPFLPVIAVVGLLGAALGTVKDDAQRMTSATVGWGHMVQGVFAEAGARIHAVMKPAFDFIEWGFGEVGKAVIYAGNLIINSFRAAYTDIVFVFSAIPDAVEAGVIGAVNAVIRGVNDMVAKAVAGINVIISAANKLGAGFELIPTDAPLKEVANPAAGRLAGRANQRNADIERIMGEDVIGGFLRDAAKRAAGFAEQDAAKVGGRRGRSGGKSETDRYAEIVQAQRQSIEAMKLEAQTMFMTEEAASRLRIEQDLLNKAANDNIKLTPQQTAELKALAAETASVEASTKALKDAMGFAKDVTGGFFADLKNGLMQGKSLWESFGDAAMNVLNKILDKMLEMAVNSLFTSGKGGFGSFLSSIFGALGGIGGGGLPLPLYEKGTDYVPRTGPAIVHQGEMVIPRRTADKIRSGQATGGNVINFAPVIDARGADPAQISMLRAEMRAQSEAMPRLIDSRMRTQQTRGVRA